MITIEDFHEDILGKAARGLGVSKNALVDEAGVGIERVQALLGGEVDEDAIRATLAVLVSP